MTKYATFFGGAINDTETQEYKETVLIGEYLSKNGYIIKNGGYRGLMEAVSKGSFPNNIGYTCKTFGHFVGNKYLTETVVCENIFERLNCLISNSELFIVQKGGIGTLSELFLTLDFIRKLKDKPKIILIGNFWKNIFNSLSCILNENDLSLFIIVSDYNEFINLIL